MIGYPKSSQPWIVYVSTFPPRTCGIATFTQDLMDTFDNLYAPKEKSKVIAMNIDKKSNFKYDKNRVIFKINQNEKEEYIKTAEQINNLQNVMVVNIQHEFGIFGGEYGDYIIDFIKELSKPIVLTLHTVLPSPNEKLKKNVEELGKNVDVIIVMTETSKKILLKDYTIDENKIKIIPHGIHPELFSDGIKEKAILGLSNKIVLSTFGLLSKGKGIEYGIEALPQIVEKYPDVEYHIIGATHPVVVKEEGEVYRESLIEKVKKLKLEKNVFFHNKYLDLSELLCFLKATDIYMSLPLDPNQAVSGTLSYALGTGRPVIATSFAQAKEDVTPEIGILVDFKNPKEITEALFNLLDKPEQCKEMGKKAYFRTRSKTWQNAALSYMNEYIKLAPNLAKIEKNLPQIKLDHIIELTDEFGMIQFAKLTKPDTSSGYTIDDNARALIAITKCFEQHKSEKLLDLIKIYLNFIDYVAQFFGEFYNYVNYDRSIPIEKNHTDSLEDARARALCALSYVATSSSIPENLKDKASTLFKYSMETFFPEHPRSIAFFIKSLTTWYSVDSSEKNKSKIIELSDKIITMYRENSNQNWHWFSDSLTYSNAILPEALALAYKITQKEEFLKISEESMDFLINYSFGEKLCMPIGQKGWLQKGGEKQLYDQQPEEVSTLIEALVTLYKITKKERYKELSRNAFDWFLGHNTLQQVVYDQTTGGCYDGVGKEYINLNQGAESTVMYLLARIAIENISENISDLYDPA